MSTLAHKDKHNTCKYYYQADEQIPMNISTNHHGSFIINIIHQHWNKWQGNAIIHMTNMMAIYILYIEYMVTRPAISITISNLKESHWNISLYSKLKNENQL